ncbi:MAG: LLM class flavin-dependent oxidoreductase, partial [Chitinophagaceae bacterium]
MGKRLSFGYLCDFRNPPPWHRPWAQFYAEMLDFIVEAETLGFEGIWLPEHHNAEDGFMPSPMTVLAAVAARTSRVKIGAAVALAPLHHPVRFAEDCAILDILSNGRLEMAIAVGYRRRETDAMGVPFEARGGRTDAFVD